MTDEARHAMACPPQSIAQRRSLPLNLTIEDRVNSTTRVTRSRFEIERDGHVNYLEFDTDGQGWMTIWHTEVAESQRGKGLGLELVRTAFQYAKDNSLQVDVICPLAKRLLDKHPELKILVGNK